MCGTKILDKLLWLTIQPKTYIVGHRDDIYLEHTGGALFTRVLPAVLIPNQLETNFQLVRTTVRTGSHNFFVSIHTVHIISFAGSH